jgi:uncharacterized protein YbbC (DUF1343 family)
MFIDPIPLLPRGPEASGPPWYKFSLPAGSNGGVSEKNLRRKLFSVVFGAIPKKLGARIANGRAVLFKTPTTTEKPVTGVPMALWRHLALFSNTWLPHGLSSNKLRGVRRFGMRPSKCCKH